MSTRGVAVASVRYACYSIARRYDVNVMTNVHMGTCLSCYYVAHFKSAQNSKERTHLEKVVSREDADDLKFA
jgi:hypothetical protein